MIAHVLTYTSQSFALTLTKLSYKGMINAPKRNINIKLILGFYAGFLMLGKYNAA